MRPWGLIFDVDGVVADTETLNARASVLMFEQLYGLRPRPEDFLPFLGHGDERYVEGVAEKYGVTLDTDAAVARRAENFFRLLQDEPLPAAPGVLDLIREAREAPHVRLAIATSGRRDKQFPVLAGAGLRLEWFSVVLTGEDVTQKKPDPQIYRLTGERLGLAPDRCVVLEDAPAGVESARSAGMKCVAVTSSAPRQDLFLADLIVDSLTELTLACLERDLLA